jgi:S1-C subfamily serine protease
VNVAADTEVTLNLTKFDCLFLTEIKVGGKIEALGLRDGDRLIRVDGQQWENLRIFEAQVEGSLGRDETTWTVIRNGAELDVKFRGTDLMKIMEKRRDEGGERLRMEPALRN